MSMKSWATGGVVLRRACRLLDPQVVLVALVALVVEAGLRLSTLPRLTRLLGIRLAQDGEPEQQDSTLLPGLPVPWLRRRAVAVKRVFRHWPFESTCLRRALVLGQRIRKLDPTLVIGVRHDDSGTLAAHAWLVVAGVALDPLASQYEALHDLRRD
ncbi:MAG: lasso peptide biosynthesis B2 protein [Pseudonocardiales bacterium]|nr:MAG: lasso peptide biosynthesis B2 protein [Pseudonocardiales bacterium]